MATLALLSYNTKGVYREEGMQTHPVLGITKLSIDLFLELPTQKRPRVTFDRTR